MDVYADYLPYPQTNSFSKIVMDYLYFHDDLKAFWPYPGNTEGIAKAIEAKQGHQINRHQLVSTLLKQYGETGSAKVKSNIALLAHENTFTVTTAHQPNIFTGHLYFIYKIIHAIRLADDLNNEFNDKKFVPVFYMGSEDADLEELGEVNIEGTRYQWETKQKGAVGRMFVDEALLKIIDAISGQISVHPHGSDIIETLRTCYSKGKTIQQATFEFVNKLFGGYGLVILLPDEPSLKKEFLPVALRELKEQFSHPLVKATVEKFPDHYKVQASGREINLFYLKDDIRERIEFNGDKYTIANTTLEFNFPELEQEFNIHPDRTSPNVILRPVFQCMVLPDVVFIGGGGELAYWLELKAVFDACNVPCPAMVLRNSFMIVPAKVDAKISRMKIEMHNLFRTEEELIREHVYANSDEDLTLFEQMVMLQKAYTDAGVLALKIDPTLEKHVEAISAQAIKKMEGLGKKLFRAQKRKNETELRHISVIKRTLFPGNKLQERVDNFLPWYARHGREFFTTIFESSQGLQQEFCIITEKAGDK